MLCKYKRLFLILLLAFALRIYRLAHQSIWYDEGLSIYYASQDFFEMLTGVSSSDHPPLHSIALHFWMKLAGRSEFSVRYLSLWWGVLSIPLVFKLGQHLFDWKVGTLAGFLISVSPFHIWYSQEGRMYTLALAFCLLSVHLLLRLLNEPDFKLWLAFVLSSTLGLYTHFYVSFFLLFENIFFFLWWVWRARRHLFKWIASQAIILLLFLPWGRFVAEQYATNATYWEGAIGLARIIRETIIAFGVGRTLREGSLIVIGFSSLMLLGAVTSLLKADLACKLSRLWRAAFLLLYLIVPTTALFAISYNRPKFAPRYLFPSFPAFCLLISAGLKWLAGMAKSERRHLVAPFLLSSFAFVIGMATLSLTNLYFEEEYARPDFRSVVDYIVSHALPDDAILLISGHMYPAFSYYYEGELPVHPLPRGLLPSTKEPLDYRAVGLLNPITEGRGRLWLVLWQNRIADPTDVLLDQLLMKCQRLGVGRNFHEINLLLFSLEGKPRFSARPRPRYRCNANFSDKIKLLGYDLDSFSFRPGQTIRLSLYWEALREMEEDYHVFTHLLSKDERIYGQHDKVAGSDFYPTSNWKRGTIIKDDYEILVLPETPPGSYVIEVGLYTFPDIERLPLKAGGDRVILADVEIR